MEFPNGMNYSEGHRHIGGTQVIWDKPGISRGRAPRRARHAVSAQGLSAPRPARFSWPPPWHARQGGHEDGASPRTAGYAGGTEEGACGHAGGADAGGASADACAAGADAGSASPARSSAPRAAGPWLAWPRVEVSEPWPSGEGRVVRGRPARPELRRGAQSHCQRRLGRA